MARRARRRAGRRERARSARPARCASSTSKSEKVAAGARRGAEDRRRALRRVPRALRAVRAHLDNYGVAYTLVPTLVRGLDYCTRTAFEFVGRGDRRAELDLRRRPLRRARSRRSAGRRPGRSASAPGSSACCCRWRPPGGRRAARAGRLRSLLETGRTSRRRSPLVIRAAPRGPERATSTTRAARCKGQLTHASRLGARAVVVEWGPERSNDPRAPASPTRRSPTAELAERLATMTGATWARRAARGARRRAAHAGRLGRAPARPRRSRVRRPARLDRHRPAGDQPGARAEAAAAARRDPERVRAPRRGRGRRARAGERQPGPPDRRGRAPGRPPGDPLPLPAAPVPARRGERRRDAAPALPLARPPPRRGCSATCACARGWSRRSGGSMEEAGFLEIETPILFKPTPEGARDFIVPSRLQPGRFFALPQSPQILKQLLVIAGFERYFQIALCFRDEDLRADRVQEITQLDVEMAFPEASSSSTLMERMISTVWRECLGVELEMPFPRLDVRRGDAALRHRQARPPLRARDRGRDRGDARLRVQASSASAEAVRCLTRAAGALARRARRRWRSSRRSGAARDSRTSSSTRRARCARRSLKFLSEAELAGARAPSPATTVLFGADTAGDRRAGARGAAPTQLGERARPDRRGRVALPLGDRLPDVRVVRGGAALGRRAPSVHAADARVGGAARQRPGRGAGASPTT